MKSELVTRSVHLYQLLRVLYLKEAINLLRQQYSSKVPYIQSLHFVHLREGVKVFLLSKTVKSYIDSSVAKSIRAQSPAPI